MLVLYPVKQHPVSSCSYVQMVPASGPHPPPSTRPAFPPARRMCPPGGPAVSIPSEYTAELSIVLQADRYNLHSCLCTQDSQSHSSSLQTSLTPPVLTSPSEVTRSSLASPMMLLQSALSAPDLNLFTPAPAPYLASTPNLFASNTHAPPPVIFPSHEEQALT